MSHERKRSLSELLAGAEHTAPANIERNDLWGPLHGFLRRVMRLRRMTSSGS
jgi:hypothetical protein